MLSFFKDPKTGKIDGPMVSYHSNGMVYEVINFINGLKEGDFKEFDSTGRLAEEGSYKNNLKTGEWVLYNNLGSKFEVVNFVEGKEHGIAKTYHTNGNVSSIGTYKAGEPTGTWISYNKDGIETERLKYFPGIKDPEKIPVNQKQNIYLSRELNEHLNKSQEHNKSNSIKL